MPDNPRNPPGPRNPLGNLERRRGAPDCHGDVMHGNTPTSDSDNGGGGLTCDYNGLGGGGGRGGSAHDPIGYYMDPFSQSTILYSPLTLISIQLPQNFYL